MPDRLLTRRTALASTLTAVAAVGATACEEGPADPGASTPATPSGTASATGAPTGLSDTDRVEQVVRSAVAASAVVDAVRTSVAGLEATLAPVSSALEAHVALLVEATPDLAEQEPDTPRVPGRAAAALARVDRVLQRLEREVREAALTSESGDLARVLASMAASLAQHATALTTAPGGTQPA